jgi:hypothetical protein
MVRQSRRCVSQGANESFSVCHSEVLCHENDGGCWITKVFPDGNAAKAGGMEEGDQLAAINGISAIKLRVDQIYTLITEAPNPKDIELMFLLAVPLTNAWREWSGLEYSNQPRFYSSREFERLPSVTFSFAGNVTLTMTPDSYMEGVPTAVPWRGKRDLTNRIYANEPLGAVLGANAMFGYDILFDMQDQRVGLARADCSFTHTRQS